MKMKTTEEQPLSPTQQTLIDHLEKFANSPVDLIVTATGLNKLLVTNSLKILLEKKKLVEVSDTTPPVYNLVATAKKITNVADKKSVKTETAKIALPKTEVTKKTADDEVVLKKENGRDTSKLKFNGNEYGKGRLVLAVVKKYMEDNPRTTLTKLKEVFPDELQNRYGMVQEVSKAKKLSVDRDRFFLKPEDLIKVGDKKVAVCSQFGSNNLPLKHLKSLGFVIK